MTEIAAQRYDEYQYRRWLEDPVDLGKRMRDALVPARQEPATSGKTLLKPPSAPVSDERVTDYMIFNKGHQRGKTADAVAQQFHQRIRDALVPARQEPALTYNTDLVPILPHPQQSTRERWDEAFAANKANGGQRAPEITARQRDYATLKSEYNDARIMMQWSLAGGYRAPEYFETVARYEAARMAMHKHLEEGIALRGKLEVIRDADLFEHTYNPPSVLAVAPEKSGDPPWPSDMAHEHARALVKEGVKKLSPAARKVLRAELDKADAPLTGRSAQDAAIGGIGRALTGGMTRYGLRTGA